MTVKVKELNNKRIQDLTQRSDYNLLTKFALELILGYENTEPDSTKLKFSKAITNLYRTDKGTLTIENNRIVEGALIRTLGGDRFIYPEDRLLHENLLHYFKVKNAKKCPSIGLEIGGGEDANRD